MDVSIKVEGMSCNHCKMAVEKAAGAVEAVTGAVVNLDAKEVVVSFDGEEASVVEAVKSAVKEAGYEPV